LAAVSNGVAAVSADAGTEPNDAVTIRAVKILAIVLVTAFLLEKGPLRPIPEGLCRHVT
jgi:hypothetical protein